MRERPGVDQAADRLEDADVTAPDRDQSDRRTEHTWARLLGGAAGTDRNWNTVRTLVELTR